MGVVTPSDTRKFPLVVTRGRCSAVVTRRIGIHAAPRIAAPTQGTTAVILCTTRTRDKVRIVKVKILQSHENLQITAIYKIPLIVSYIFST